VLLGPSCVQAARCEQPACVQRCTGRSFTLPTLVAELWHGLDVLTVVDGVSALQITVFCCILHAPGESSYSYLSSCVRCRASAPGLHARAVARVYGSCGTSWAGVWRAAGDPGLRSRSVCVSVVCLACGQHGASSYAPVTRESPMNALTPRAAAAVLVADLLAGPQVAWQGPAQGPPLAVHQPAPAAHIHH
jgi:hypothetical protein